MAREQRLAGVPEGTRDGIQDPTVREDGWEQHPAFGLIGASRVYGKGTLFDSEVQHQHYVVIELREAERKRELNRDFVHASTRAPIVGVAMSQAQWAEFVSSMNQGDGVPCTLQYRESVDHGGKVPGRVPGLPYQPRIQQSLDEVRTAADRALAEVRKSFEAYKAHPTKAGLRDLEARLDNATPNMTFAAKSLAEAAETVVSKARADLEAMVAAAAERAGLNPGDMAGALELPAGEETDDDGEVQG